MSGLELLREERDRWTIETQGIAYSTPPNGLKDKAKSDYWDDNPDRAEPTSTQMEESISSLLFKNSKDGDLDALITTAAKSISKGSIGVSPPSGLQEAKDYLQSVMRQLHGFPTEVEQQGQLSDNTSVHEEEADKNKENINRDHLPLSHDTMTPVNKLSISEDILVDTSHVINGANIQNQLQQDNNRVAVIEHIDTKGLGDQGDIPGSLPAPLATLSHGMGGQKGGMYIPGHVGASTEGAQSLATVEKSPPWFLGSSNSHDHLLSIISAAATAATTAATAALQNAWLPPHQQQQHQVHQIKGLHEDSLLHQPQPRALDPRLMAAQQLSPGGLLEGSHKALGTSLKVVRLNNPKIISRHPMSMASPRVTDYVPLFRPLPKSHEGSHLITDMPATAAFVSADVPVSERNQGHINVVSERPEPQPWPLSRSPAGPERVTQHIERVQQQQQQQQQPDPPPGDMTPTTSRGKDPTRGPDHQEPGPRKMHSMMQLEAQKHLHHQKIQDAVGARNGTLAGYRVEPPRVRGPGDGQIYHTSDKVSDASAAAAGIASSPAEQQQPLTALRHQTSTELPSPAPRQPVPLPTPLQSSFAQALYFIQNPEAPHEREPSKQIYLTSSDNTEKEEAARNIQSLLGGSFNFSVAIAQLDALSKAAKKVTVSGQQPQLEGGGQHVSPTDISGGVAPLLPPWEDEEAWCDLDAFTKAIQKEVSYRAVPFPRTKQVPPLAVDRLVSRLHPGNRNNTRGAAQPSALIKNGSSKQHDASQLRHQKDESNLQLLPSSSFPPPAKKHLASPHISPPASRQLLSPDRPAAVQKSSSRPVLAFGRRVNTAVGNTAVGNRVNTAVGKASGHLISSSSSRQQGPPAKEPQPSIPLRLHTAARAAAQRAPPPATSQLYAFGTPASTASSGDRIFSALASIVLREGDKDGGTRDSEESLAMSRALHLLRTAVAGSKGAGHPSDSKQKTSSVQQQQHASEHRAKAKGRVLNFALSKDPEFMYQYENQYEYGHGRNSGESSEEDEEEETLTVKKLQSDQSLSQEQGRETAEAGRRRMEGESLMPLGPGTAPLRASSHHLPRFTLVRDLSQPPDDNDINNQGSAGIPQSPADLPVNQTQASPVLDHHQDVVQGNTTRPILYGDFMLLAHPPPGAPGYTDAAGATTLHASLPFPVATDSSSNQSHGALGDPDWQAEEARLMDVLVEELMGQILSQATSHNLNSQVVLPMDGLPSLPPAPLLDQAMRLKLVTEVLREQVDSMIWGGSAVTGGDIDKEWRQESSTRGDRGLHQGEQDVNQPLLNQGMSSYQVSESLRYDNLISTEVKGEQPSKIKDGPVGPPEGQREVEVGSGLTEDGPTPEHPSGGVMLSDKGGIDQGFDSKEGGKGSKEGATHELVEIQSTQNGVNSQSSFSEGDHQDVKMEQQQQQQSQQQELHQGQQELHQDVIASPGAAAEFAVSQLGSNGGGHIPPSGALTHNGSHVSVQTNWALEAALRHQLDDGGDVRSLHTQTSLSETGQDQITHGRGITPTTVQVPFPISVPFPAVNHGLIMTLMTQGLMNNQPQGPWVERPADPSHLSPSSDPRMRAIMSQALMTRLMDRTQNKTSDDLNEGQDLKKSVSEVERLGGQRAVDATTAAASRAHATASAAVAVAAAVSTAGQNDDVELPLGRFILPGLEQILADSSADFDFAASAESLDTHIRTAAGHANGRGVTGRARQLQEQDLRNQVERGLLEDSLREISLQAMLAPPQSDHLGFRAHEKSAGPHAWSGHEIQSPEPSTWAARPEPLPSMQQQQPAHEVFGSWREVMPQPSGRDLMPQPREGVPQPVVLTPTTLSNTGQAPSLNSYHGEVKKLWRPHALPISEDQPEQGSPMVMGMRVRSRGVARSSGNMADSSTDGGTVTPDVSSDVLPWRDVQRGAWVSHLGVGHGRSSSSSSDDEGESEEEEKATRRASRAGVERRQAGGVSAARMQLKGLSIKRKKLLHQIGIQDPLLQSHSISSVTTSTSSLS